MIYAIDLGNGFSKRTFGSETFIDPTVYAFPNTFFGDGDKLAISINNQQAFLLGTDAVNSGQPLQYVLGDSNIKRYESDSYKQLVLAFIAKDLKDDVTIEKLVLGLPIDHFKAKKDALVKSFAKTKNLAMCNGESYLIDIKEVMVVPQPMGTYIHTLNSQKQEVTLIVDAGYGTVDVAELTGLNSVRNFGADIGLKQAFIEINSYLKETYADCHISVGTVHDALLNGLKYKGAYIDIFEDEFIQQALKNHFDRLYAMLVENYGSFTKFDKVIFTGGTAEMHKKHIEAKEEPNFIIVKNPQTANVEGFYTFGKTMK
ncbi:MAG: hypothetical protein ACRDCC_09895 [Culicoidibacterales bacterium]